MGSVHVCITLLGRSCHCKFLPRAIASRYISSVLFLVILINSLSVVVRAKITINIDFKSQAIAGTFATVLSSIVALYLALSRLRSKV